MPAEDGPVIGDAVICIAVSGPGPAAEFDGEHLDQWAQDRMPPWPPEVWLRRKVYVERLGGIKHCTEIHVLTIAEEFAHRFLRHRLATGLVIYHHESITPEEAELRLVENYAP